MTEEEIQSHDIKTRKILTFRNNQEKIASFLQNLILGMIENGIGTPDDFYALTLAINSTVQACNSSDSLYDEDVY